MVTPRIYFSVGVNRWHFTLQGVRVCWCNPGFLLACELVTRKLACELVTRKLACENIRFSSLFVAWDVSASFLVTNLRIKKTTTNQTNKQTNKNIKQGKNKKQKQEQHQQQNDQIANAELNFQQCSFLSEFYN